MNLILPKEQKYRKHVYHLFVVRIKNRDIVRNELSNYGIATGIHYPIPIHLQDAYKFLGHKIGDYPVAEKVSNEILSLPMFPELTDEQIIYVADKLKLML